MTYLFMALAVFTVVRLLHFVIDAPEWVWQLGIIAASAAIVLFPWQEGEHWYMVLAVPGIVCFLQLLENLLIVKSDEALSTIQRRR